MAFMVPEYQEGCFITVRDSRDEYLGCGMKEDYVPSDYPEGHAIEEYEGWFCRLSAHGYMDCTDWDGPFDSEEEARDHIQNMFDVDPDTGDDIDDNGDDNE